MPHGFAGIFEALFATPLTTVWQMLFSVGFAVALGVTLTAEALMPAVPGQRIFSTSFWQDFVWFFYESILHATVISTYVYALEVAFEKFTPFLRLEIAGTWPALGRFLLGFLILDFLYWLQHYCNHKFRALWEFHAVHHSQRELNFFSDFRYHVVEYLVRHTILTIPFLVLSFHAPTILAVALVQRWYTRFYHGNIRTNLGPLRYLLVTPQSHRVHHSVRVEHHDMNFGSILSIWDRLFGTQHPDAQVYPETGVPDTEFPHEHSPSLGRLVLMPVVQLAYPFRVLGRRMARRARVGIPRSVPVAEDRS